MSQQLQANGGEDFIVLRGEMQNFQTMKITAFQIVVKDQYAVASFSDPYLAKKMAQHETKAGNNNIKYSEKINSAIEKYPGKTKEEIARTIGKKLKEQGAKLRK